MEQDLKALDDILELIKKFTDKNPIKKYKINYNRIREKINQLKTLENVDKETKERSIYDILKKIRFIIRREFHPKIFFIVGGHGGIIIEDVGFCEFDFPEYAINRLIEKMNLAIETNMPYNIEIAMSCLEWLKNRHPKKISEFLRLFKKGRFEIINPTYTQPYNLIIGPESNIKQYEYGLRVLKELELDCNIFYCSESSLHPQIPQILKGFNIKFGSLRTRLLGQNPTSNSGYIDWIGLDDTKISTITDQTSVFNGEYWHGTFFREIPSLLFQSVARPFMKHIIYSSIEDFIMPQSHQKEIWRISKFSNIFGEFLLCSDFFEKIEKDGEFKFNRDQFSIGDYIFIPGDLFLNNKICESSLISAEVVNCVLGLFNENSNDSFFNELWKKLLLTQAHDNYAVPFITSGAYSAQQLSNEEYNKLKLNNEIISISDLSLRLQEEIQNKCKSFIEKNLHKLTTFLEKDPNISNKIIKNLIIFNPMPFSRRDIFAIELKLDNPADISLISEKSIEFQYQNSILKFIPEVPPVGYKIYSIIKKESKPSKSQTFFYDLEILKDNKTIEVKFLNKKIFELTFKSNYDYILSIEDHFKTNIEDFYLIKGKIENNEFLIKIAQYENVNRLEFSLISNSLRQIILNPTIKIEKSFINYPFGIEETKRSNIQTLDFLWLKGKREGILYMQKNSQKFIINRDNFKIRNLISTRGEFRFAIVITGENDTNSILNYVNSFNFKLLGIETNFNYNINTKSRSFLSIEPQISFINLWRRKNNSFLRIFNPINEENRIELNGPLIKNPLKEVNLNYKEIQSIPDHQIEIKPWKIKTIKI
ncbi:MAG: hypothetical protein ACFFCM_01185 [Promethearchaeota archaeon]